MYYDWSVENERGKMAFAINLAWQSKRLGHRLQKLTKTRVLSAANRVPSHSNEIQPSHHVWRTCAFSFGHHAWQSNRGCAGRKPSTQAQAVTYHSNLVYKIDLEWVSPDGNEGVRILQTCSKVKISEESLDHSIDFEFDGDGWLQLEGVSRVHWSEKQ